MKRLMKISLLIIGIITGTVSAAEKFSVEISNASMINVSLSEVANGEKLTLKDAKGITLYNAILEATPLYQKFFNFRDVTNGIYFIETEGLYTIKVTPIIKNENGVSLINDSAITIFKPQVDVKEAIVSMQFINTTKKPVSVRLYDSESVMLDETVNNTEDVLKKSYDFSKMPKGEYIVYFSQEGRSFVKEIIIE